MFTALYREKWAQSCESRASLPTSVVINGCDSPDQAIEAMRTFKPLTKTELSALLAKTREAALSGTFELFKTFVRFDGTAQHPQWMG